MGPLEVILVLLLAYLAGVYFLSRSSHHRFGQKTKTRKKSYHRRKRSVYRPRTQRWPTLKLTPEQKGKIGENRVVYMLDKYIPQKFYLINDIILRDETGRTSQLDHILIMESGIYVIETKNYSGRIFGKDLDRTWTQVIGGNIKNTFYNPVWQNSNHIKMLKKVTKIKYPIISMIVFVEGDISHVVANNVYTPETMIQKIKSQEEKRIESSELYIIFQQLAKIKAENAEAKQYHISNVINAKNQSYIKPKICPRCKTGILNKKDWRYGSFMSCSNYPRCEYTEPIPTKNNKSQNNQQAHR